MPKIDHSAVALNAAGIADAFRALQRDDQLDENRMELIRREREGSVGVLMQIAEAGELMERYRANQGPNATWGGDLPYLYDVWDLIAWRMWDRQRAVPLNTLVERAVEEAVNAEAS